MPADRPVTTDTPPAAAESGPDLVRPAEPTSATPLVPAEPATPTFETPPPPPPPERREKGEKEKEREQEKGARGEKAPKNGKLEKKARKEKKKEERRLRDATRHMDAWERYRALRDTVDDANDLVDLADHKTRFALVIVGALNAAVFILGARLDLATLFPAAVRPFALGLGALYCIVTVYFLIQAIESLRPRHLSPNVPQRDRGDPTGPQGLRFFSDIVGQDAEAYASAWREVRLGQINAELARQAYLLAQINAAKYRALHRLYLGLKIMTLMAAALLAVAATFAWLSHADGAPKRKHHPSTAVLPPAQRIPLDDVPGPSGVAYHPGLRRLFVVGDKGLLAEVTLDGRLLRTQPIKGDLEDVAVHTPSGRLVLLSEKKSRLIVLDPRSLAEIGHWKMDRAFFIGHVPSDRNAGFEGLGFRAQAGRPGGGLFYLTHQRNPALLVSFVFDPASAPGPLPQESLVHRFPIDGKDLTAVTYVPSLDRVLVLSDVRDRLLVLRDDGTEEADIAVPGTQQEGLALDDAGTLWIADDREQCLLKIEGGLAAIEAHLRALRGDSATAASE